MKAKGFGVHRRAPKGWGPAQEVVSGGEAGCKVRTRGPGCRAVFLKAPRATWPDLGPTVRAEGTGSSHDSDCVSQWTWTRADEQMPEFPACGEDGRCLLKLFLPAHPCAHAHACSAHMCTGEDAPREEAAGP